jgi:imidazolonepropionase-like amidohydrolase
MAMKAKGIFLVPTLSVMDAMAAKSPDKPSPPLQAFIDGARRTVSTAHDVGAPIALGSDPAESDRHGRNAEELVAMMRCGLSALDVLRSASSSAAELLGMANDIGAIEAGKYADLIGVDGDPLGDITTLSRVRFVMKGGRVIKHDALRPDIR